METRAELVARASSIGIKVVGKTRREIETEIKQMSSANVETEGLTSEIAPQTPVQDSEQDDTTNEKKKKKTPTKYPRRLGHGILQLSNTGLSTGG